MEYTVKLRSPCEFERAVRPYQAGNEIDISENCEDLGSGRGGNWLEQTPILNDDNPPELVFADEDGNETVVRLLAASGVKCAEDEGEFPANSFIKCVYWQNQESAVGDELFGDEEPIEIEGDVDPAKITFAYQNVRKEDGSLIPVLKRGSVKYGDVEMCFSTPEGDGSVEQVRVFTGGELCEFGEHEVES